jgi:hypothetical protein
MPTYRVQEQQGGSLDSGTIGFAKYVLQPMFLVYRDDLLVGPYNSREDAELAIERLKKADRAQT